MSWRLCLLSNSAFIIMTSITTIISPLTLFAQLQEWKWNLQFSCRVKRKQVYNGRIRPAIYFLWPVHHSGWQGVREPIPYVCCCLFCVRPHQKKQPFAPSANLKFLRLTHIFGFLREEAAAPTQTHREEPDPGIEPTTFILWGTGANHCINCVIPDWFSSTFLQHSIF